MTQTKRPNYVLWMLCVFMLLSAASYFFRPKEPEISYAEVVQLFEQEKVKSFTVQDTTLTLKLREAVDGKTELRKELYDFDLFYDDLNDLVVEQKAAGILEDYNYSANHSPNYLAIALPYVIAVAGLFAIWYFFSMRASGGGNDRMAKFGNATFRPSPTLPAATRRRRSLRRSWISCATRKGLSSSARVFPRACCSSALRERARRCSPARSRVRRAWSSSPSPARTLWRCTSASAQAACATC